MPLSDSQKETIARAMRDSFFAQSTTDKNWEGTKHLYLDSFETFLAHLDDAGFTITEMPPILSPPRVNPANP